MKTDIESFNNYIDNMSDEKLDEIMSRVDGDTKEYGGIPIIDYAPLKQKRKRQPWVYKTDYDLVVRECHLWKQAFKAAMVVVLFLTVILFL
jgi:hypothetical protein